jgi:hypothetical protein
VTFELTAPFTVHRFPAFPLSHNPYPPDNVMEKLLGPEFKNPAILDKRRNFTEGNGNIQLIDSRGKKLTQGLFS